MKEFWKSVHICQSYYQTSIKRCSHLCPRSHQTCPRLNQLCLRSSQWRSLSAIYVLDQGLYGGPNDVLLNFGGQTPKTEILRARIGLSSLNEKKIQILMIWKLLSRSLRKFYREYAPRTSLRGWSHGLPQTNPRWRHPSSLISEKMSITPDWIKISAPNFVGRCITAARRWPRDQKSKPEVNSRDVIKWTSEA